MPKVVRTPKELNRTTRLDRPEARLCFRRDRNTSCRTGGVQCAPAESAHAIARKCRWSHRPRTADAPTYRLFDHDSYRTPNEVQMNSRSLSMESAAGPIRRRFP